MSVSANWSSCDWSASSYDSWIHITSGSSGSGSGSVSYSVDANNTGGFRTGSMTIAEKTFTISQTTPACTYSISPASKSFTSSGGSGSVSVSTNVSSCTWSASSNNSWIHITSGSSGSGSGSVRYSVDAATGDGRTGTMTIAGKTFTVSQTHGCTYSINSTSKSFTDSGGSGSVSVSANLSSCTWTASSNDESWIHITSGSSGSGSGTGTVVYSVDVNTGNTRTGSMIIAGGTYNVSQTGTSGPKSLPEAVDNNSLEYSTWGNKDWFGQSTTKYYDGDAAQSGDIGNGQKSVMQGTITGPGKIGFYWKVSSEESHDKLKFYIDGVWQAGISGNTDWDHKTFTIPSGYHKLRWIYAKDGSVSKNSDCGWVDKITWEPGIDSSVILESETSDDNIFKPTNNFGSTSYHTWGEKRSRVASKIFNICV